MSSPERCANIRVNFLLLIFALTLSTACQDIDTSITPVREHELSSNTTQNYFIGLSTSEESAHIVLNEPEKSDFLTKGRSLSIELLGGMDQIISFYPQAQILEATLTADEVRLLRENPSVEFIEADVQFALNTSASVESVYPLDEQIPWGVTSVGGGQVYKGNRKAFILDTGIDLNHPDLNVDSTQGFTAFHTMNDGHGHGTHVAGVIGALKNGKGVVGVAPGATLIPVKILSDQGQGSLSDILNGIEFVVEHAHPGDVANLSVAGPYLKTINRAVRRAAAKQIFFTVAAGNTQEDTEKVSPASAEHSYIYTISAMDENGQFASFSNFGTHIDGSAPGVNIISTYKDGSYKRMTGTSMAAPHIAGALLWSVPFEYGSVDADPDGSPDPILKITKAKKY